MRPYGVGQTKESRIFEVRAESSKGRVHTFGSRRTRVEAEQLMRESVERVALVGGANDRYWVEEIDTTGLFEFPSKPTPRERYTTRVTSTKASGTWTGVHVDVLDGDTTIASYGRNYSFLQTFEPFRQGDRMFALVSTDYTATSVLDLHTGEIIASEEPSGNGFCPVGFYVPDWWDLHDGSTLPGSMHWQEVDDEWPSGGNFGFVWGCVWGDDSSWKVQYLDLSSVRDGVIRRDDRFGYVKLATDTKLVPQDFIRCSTWQGERRVEFYVEQGYYLSSGAIVPNEDW